MRIGVDLMGSESSPPTLFSAVLEVSGQSKDAASFLVFVTNEEALKIFKIYSESLEGKSGKQIDFCLVDEYISMEDDPLLAVRRKKGSSLSKGIQFLKEKSIDAFVTSGNTGALIAYSTFFLEPLGGVDRPPLLAALPMKNSSLSLVDVGGHVLSRADHLVQFAHFGAAYQRCSLGVEIPRIGLLNIGIESKKGTTVVKEAYKRLKEQAELPGSKIAFVGNIEGREVFEGKVDVLVTDGFTGNILLKASEGISSFIFSFLQESMQSADSKNRRDLVTALQQHFSYEEYPGALVCGVDGIIIKCHGAATKKAVVKSIREAINLVDNQLLEKIREELPPL